MRKYYFIDCGAHLGENIINFYSSLHDKHDVDQFEIIAFEPNFYLIEDLSKFTPFVEKNLKIIDKAVTTYDGFTEFRIGNLTASSSIMPTKKVWQLLEKVDVPCIDFSRWLIDNTEEEDYVIVCFDIEGAEYDIIDSLFESGTINRINEFYVEFHGKKMKGFPMEREKKMVQDLIDHFDKDVYICNYHQNNLFHRLCSTQSKPKRPK